MFQDFPEPAAAMLGESQGGPGPWCASAAFHWQDAAELLQRKKVQDLKGLEFFLDGYFSEVLTGLELPGVRDAFGHSGRYQVRELIALDTRLGAAYKERQLLEGSCVSGRRQLNRLRSLRDQRLVQRYLQAVDTNQANGLHTIVFGIVLALFSIPLRQGLLYYGGQAVTRLVDSASCSLALPPQAWQTCRLNLLEKLPLEVEKVVACGAAGEAYGVQQSRSS